MSKDIKYKISATEGLSGAVGKASHAIGSLGQKISWLRNKTKTDTDSMKRSWESIKSGINVAKKAILGIAAIGTAAAGALFVTIKKAFAKETILVKFGVKLGSRAAAKKAYKEVSDFSDVTPFTKDEVLAGADQVMNVVDPSKLREWLQILGDITAGAKAGTGLDEIASIFVKIQNKGKASMEELQQLAERGIDIYGELAKSMGVSKDAIFEMSSKGQLSSSVMEKAFRQMTSEGGKFYGMMQQLSETGDGLTSTLKGKFSSALEDFGDKFKTSAKASIQSLIDLLDRLRSDGSIERWADKSSKALKVVSELIKDIFGSDREARMGALQYLGDGLKAAARDMINIMLRHAPKIGAAIGETIMGIVTGSTRRAAILRLENAGQITPGEAAGARLGLESSAVKQMIRTVMEQISGSSSIDGETTAEWAARGKDMYDSKPWWADGVSQDPYETIDIAPPPAPKEEAETKKANELLGQIAKNTDPKNRSVMDMIQTILGRARESGGYSQTRLAQQFHNKINPFGSEGPDSYFHARIKNEGKLNFRTMEEKMDRQIQEQVKTRKKVIGVI